MTHSTCKIYCAVDTSDFDRACAIAKAMSELGIGLKLGLEFFGRNGPDGVKRLSDLCPQSDIFLDLKFHDIPNTVAGVVRSVMDLRMNYMNLHALGGLEMMTSAQDAMQNEADKRNKTCPTLLAVTILTSMNESALTETGMDANPKSQVLRLAQLAQQSGLGGVVCSAHEIEILREKCGPNFVLMVPGIRPHGSDPTDQKRTMTPAEALKKGATHLVIGRPITGAADMIKAGREILESLV
jgi:orotidine-5'-phosphate decarboxylase